mmetsp:Transcript_21487/g.54128  ORF Transcript_21487/g.54128 Transcript_21487/m.54128 type:complete len:163 (-) Transcript_21487:425-913(-)|eukprot:jgi/Tetstr1/463295/TSEL_008219.t1
MSIAYQQTDGLLGGAPRHEMTEYERRKSKAEKQAMDAVQISERRASLGAGGSSFKRNLARKSSDAAKAAHTPPRAHPLENPVGTPDDKVEAMGDEEDPTRLKDWWKRTDSASLNRKPDSAISDESTNTQFHSYAYKPQYDVAGVHCPAYFKPNDPNAPMKAH